MSDATIRLITRMKLRELKRQRHALVAQYDELAKRAGEAANEVERIGVLHEGLREIEFASRSLHADLPDLELIVHASPRAFSSDLLKLWQARLDDEFARGRRRCEFVYAFGGLLEEWASDRSDPTREERSSARSAMLAAALRPNPAPDHAATAHLKAAPFDEEKLAHEVRGEDLFYVLQEIAGNMYRGEAVRGEAKAFENNTLMRKDLSDAMSILMAEFADWKWPAEGFAARALWTRNRWRLYFDEDLPTLCLLELVARRLKRLLERDLTDPTGAVINRGARLAKLRDLNAPDVILENEVRMLADAERRMSREICETDPWTGLILQAPAQGQAAIATDSVVVQRLHEQSAVSSIRDMGSDYDGESGNMKVVALVNAEIQLARAAYPDRPVYVVKIDLRDFFASIPHGAVRTILAALRVPERWVAFVDRFLAPPLVDESGAVRPAARGVPNAHGISSLVAELLARCLDLHLHRVAKVRVIRQVDDIALLTPDAAEAVKGWRAVAEFCKACGLEVNGDKCGAVCIGPAEAPPEAPPELPPELPTRAPRWGMLCLSSAGEWAVDEPTFAAHLVQSRRHVDGYHALLRKVQSYNADAKYLVTNLGLGANLGDAHRAAAAEAVRRFHLDFFGEGTGIIDGLTALMRQRYFADTPNITVPESWIYWPVTAGGMGLQNPLVVESQYAAAYRKFEQDEPPTERPADWDTANNEWGRYYASMLHEIEPVEPAQTSVMKTLTDEFIARGAEITGGKQDSLSSYWQWVLNTYGPQILEQFGTFKFLITELVPLYLIHQQRGGGGRGDGGG